MRRRQTTRKREIPELKVIPIGGLNEIGKNMTLLECNNQIMIIDCGLSFPDDEMYGIDIVIPDFSYLIANRERIAGMVITHGHEDHIGAVPYLLKNIKIPVYGTRLTLGLVENKLKEHGIQGDLRTINAGDKIQDVLTSKRSERRIRLQIPSVLPLQLRPALSSIRETSKSTILRLMANRLTFQSSPK